MTLDSSLKNITENIKEKILPSAR